MADDSSIEELVVEQLVTKTDVTEIVDQFINNETTRDQVGLIDQTPRKKPIISYNSSLMILAQESTPSNPSNPQRRTEKRKSKVKSV